MAYALRGCACCGTRGQNGTEDLVPSDETTAAEHAALVGASVVSRVA